MLTTVDIVLIIGSFGIIYSGLRLGFWRLLGLSLGTLLASWAATKYGPALMQKISLTPTQAYLLIAFLVFLAGLFLGYLISKIFHLILLGWLDRLLGALGGIFLATLLILITAGLWPHPASRLLNYCRKKIPALGLENRFLPKLSFDSWKDYQKKIQEVNQELKKVSGEIDRRN